MRIFVGALILMAALGASAPLTEAKEVKITRENIRSFSYIGGSLNLTCYGDGSVLGRARPALVPGGKFRPSAARDTLHQAQLELKALRAAARGPSATTKTKNRYAALALKTRELAAATVVCAKFGNSCRKRRSSSSSSSSGGSSLSSSAISSSASFSSSLPYSSSSSFSSSNSSVSSKSSSSSSSSSSSTTPQCAQSLLTWQNRAFASQNGTLTVHFDAAPHAANIDGVIGLSHGAGSAYTSFAALVRFNLNGVIDVRNGSAYSYASALAYSPGTTYHFRLTVDVPAHTYSVYVKPQGAVAETTLASNFAFRSEQAYSSILDNLGFIAEIGSFQICNFSVSGGGFSSSNSSSAPSSSSSAASSSSSSSSSQPGSSSSNSSSSSISAGAWVPEIDLATGRAANPKRPGILPWKSGISLQANGEEDTDWVEEQHFYDALYQPRGLLFINTSRSDGNAQLIRLVHNEYNIRGNGAELKQVLGDHDRGKIRGYFDQFFVMHGTSGGDTHYPASAWKTLFYDDATKQANQINLESFRQADGTLMWSGVGYTSINRPGQEGLNGFASFTSGVNYYYPPDGDNTWYRGRRVWGDSYLHWLSVWDDDTHFDTSANNIGLQASDGKMFVLVINPKVPALKVAASGDAKWRFGRVAYYGMPKFIEDQTVQVSFSSGDVALDPISIVPGAQSVLYSTDSGLTWRGCSAPLSIKALFGSSGSHALWLKAINQSAVRKLTFAINPPSPSAGEPGDLTLIRNTARKAQLISNLRNAAWWSTRKYDWTNSTDKVPGVGKRYGQDEYRTQAQYAFGNALISWVEGYGSAGMHYEEARKRLLNYAGLDPVEADGENSGWWNPIPTNELCYDTYRDKQYYPAPLAYLLLAADNHMNPVDEYEIRENLGALAWSMFWYSESIGHNYYRLGDLHIRAHNHVVALFTMLAMPKFSHPFFGDATGSSTKHPLWDEPVRTTNPITREVVLANPEAGSWQHLLLGIKGEYRGLWPVQMRHGGSMYGVALNGDYGPIEEGNNRHGYEMELFQQLEEISVLLIRSGYWQQHSADLDANMGKYLGGRATGDYDDHYASGPQENRYPVQGYNVYETRLGGTNRLLNPEAQRGSQWWHTPAPGDPAVHPANLALWLKQTYSGTLAWDSFVMQYYSGRDVDTLSVFFCEPENIGQ